MDEHLYTVEKTKRTDGTERLEIHLGNAVYVLSLVGGEKLARNILSLLEIDIAAEREALVRFVIATINGVYPEDYKAWEDAASKEWQALPDELQEKIKGG